MPLKRGKRNISPHDAILELTDIFLKTESGKELENLREYIKARVAPGVLWYQEQGDRAEHRYLGMQVTAVVLGAIVPVLINVSLPVINTNNLTTLLSLVVVVVVALEGVLHYRERYRNYRTAAYALEQECFNCFLRAPPYHQCKDNELCSQFVKNAEGYIGQEVASTLKTMTVAPNQENSDKTARVKR